MQTLSKGEWIAATIAVVVVVFFLGSRFFPNFTNNNSSVANVSSATQNTNNMDQNTQATSTASTGLIIKDVVVGTGVEAKAGNLVSVQYTGKFADGKVFDSSIPRGEPFQFTLGAGQVIAGWDQGVAGMKVGGKRTLTISPELGYGASGYPPVIPPNSTLYFDVELTAVQAQ